MRSTKCVVLGGGGFIGTNLCRYLLGRVAELRAFGYGPSFPDAVRGVVWHEGGFDDAGRLAAAVDGCDTVFHLISSATPASPVGDTVADLTATLRLLELCRAGAVGRIVFVSSGGTVYGVPATVPTPEDAPTDPITAYGIAKLAIEKHLALYRHLHGLDYRILRVANPFGPFQTAGKGQGVIAAFLRRALAGQPVEIWGTGDVVRDYVYVDDVVEALVLAATHAGDERLFNIGSGVGRSLAAIVDDLGAVLGRPPEIVHREGRAVDVPRSVLDITRARHDLGWEPRTDWHDGLRRTRDWIAAAGLG
ncbi:NAD-dependent epimerase/dehydratase family protein [Azospirillum halopraeferens]|uniref:NAD-dependent epimerase/dehydratase family protein n=1 Tax=Azospirillum halopraeferens TaxID=34010 RepID=UPI000424F2F6|nr:NAD-dependent epimerase/dehydratase family protein [Azospirillum halopraeferens]